MRKVIMGNHSLSYGALLSRVQVISAYPITPQTQVVELLSEMCASGELKAKFINVESEHSAMAALIGASAAGARTFSATSAHGLTLMHELLHWAAGARLPIVLGNINRAMAPGWTIWADQTDSLSQRDTGWIQFYCSSNQEVLDTIIQAFKISEKVLLPSMIVLDAFFLSHTYEPVDIPDQVVVDEYLPPYKPKYVLDTKDPHTFGGITSPEYYYEIRYKMEMGMRESVEVIKQAGKEYGELFGREYGLIEDYRCEDAEIIFITSGTAASTAKVVVDELREEGKKVGNLKIRVFRPFPFKELRRIIEHAKKVAVIDRNISFGHHGIFAQEVKSALYNHSNIPVFGFVAGLGGRDINPQTIKEIYHITESNEYPSEKVFWIGVKK
ncbi:MAG: pyruvate ferredoxin oxidoreductase [Acidobacteriota bacterium]